MTTVRTRKKLIEVALPLEAINAAAAREKSIRHGHPSTLHLWWARRPLAAARAVIFSQMVDDPSACPEEFPTEEEQDRERQRLHDLIKQLVLWENTTNETVLEAARDEIRKSWRRTCADNKDHPQAAELFNPEKLPAFHDPFAGGGALPLEAQRLGLEAYASDLNPVAVLINKAMIEIPPKFAGQPPVNPDDRKKMGSGVKWKGAAGLAADVRYYGKWMRDEAEKRIGHLYPKVLVTPEMVAERPDLKPYQGRELTVIAWLWARTVKSPNPAFRDVDVPLASTFMLSTKPGKEAYVEPVVEGHSYRFTVKVGKPQDTAAVKTGTKLARGANFKCLMSGVPIEPDYIKGEGTASRIGASLMAIVADGDRSRVYLSPSALAEGVARSASPEWKPSGLLVEDARAFTPYLYGLSSWSDLFTNRQLVALSTFAGLIADVMKLASRSSNSRPSEDPLVPGGVTVAYGEALAVYLAFALGKGSNYWSSLCTWHQSAEKLVSTFGLPVLPMTWDFTEANPFSSSSGNWMLGVEQAAKALETVPARGIGVAFAGNAAAAADYVKGRVFVTDPPYYDNIPYADLADFFYVWLRKALQETLPSLFTTVAVPKAEEIVATAYRHGGKEGARKFFESGLRTALGNIRTSATLPFPISVFYAYKQQEVPSEGSVQRGSGPTSTGWETMLDAVVGSGLTIVGTWPMRTEQAGGLREAGRNSLASSVVLVCRARTTDAASATRTEFLQELAAEMGKALPILTNGEVAPVDLAQASIGPGMAVYSKYSAVIRQDGKPVTVREALQDINNAISAYRNERTSSFDPKTRFCIDFYDQFGFSEAQFDNATVLARAQAVGIDTLEREHLLVAEAGKAWLVALKSYPVGVAGLERAFAGSAWEACLRLAATLQEEGESATAALARELGEGVCARARELAVWLYTIADDRKRSQDALAFNALDASWPEIQRLLASMDRGGQQGRFA